MTGLLRSNFVEPDPFGGRFPPPARDGRARPGGYFSQWLNPARRRLSSSSEAHGARRRALGGGVIVPEVPPERPEIERPDPPRRERLTCEQRRALAEALFGDPWMVCRGDGRTPTACAPPVENGEEEVEEVLGVLPDRPEASDDRAFVPLASPVQPYLILHLHGVLNDTENASNIARAYAQAGYRTIVLAWNDEGDKARDRCVDDNDTSDEINRCLTNERERKQEEIETRLYDALNTLDWARVLDGWSSFLTKDGTAVDWAQVVLSGYSEGAGQTAFLMRRVPARGTILVSGGGDNAATDAQVGLVPAEWMYEPSQVEPARIVGLQHVDEENDFTDGWTLSGMLDEANEVDPLGDPPYGVFEERHRMWMKNLDHGRTFEPADAHQETVSNTDLFPAHMYLACMAGGQRVSWFG